MYCLSDQFMENLFRVSFKFEITLEKTLLVNKTSMKLFKNMDFKNAGSFVRKYNLITFSKSFLFLTFKIFTFTCYSTDFFVFHFQSEIKH